jgi:pyridinium-3,5-biscarboxylic acid mononucleotide synthase
MNSEGLPRLEQLARELVDGRLSMEQFLRLLDASDGSRTGEHLAGPRSLALDDVTLDLDRAGRCGFPEVIYGAGKPVEAILQAASQLLKAGQGVLCTRLSPEFAERLTARFPEGVYHPRAHTFRVAAPRREAETPPDGDSAGRRSVDRTGQVAIITAGTSDLPVAEEARETLLWMGITPSWVQDVGVAGPHRLREKLDQFLDASAVVVVAGMEGALPSVVGGYVRCPVIAVPTSVGYGAALGGIAPLLGMLNSCAANVTVVNIDAGFKGAYVAGLIARQSVAKE